MTTIGLNVQSSSKRLAEIHFMHMKLLRVWKTLIVRTELIESSSDQSVETW